MRDDCRNGASAGRSAWPLLLAFVAMLVLATGAGAAGSGQRSFASPEEAVSALVKAVRSHDRAATLAVLGAGAAGSISSGDEAADRVSPRVFHVVALPAPTER